MNSEELIKLGLTEEQADKVIALHKDKISGNYVPKATFDEEREKVKEYKKLVDDAKANATDSEELKKQIEDLKEKSKTMEAEYKKKEEHREHIESIKKLLPEDVIDADDIISRLDIDSYTYSGDTVKGLSEDIEALRKSKPHYFKAKEDKENTSDDQSNNFLKGIVGIQKPSESSENSGKDIKEPESVQLGKQLGKLRMQTEQQSQKSRETFFK